MLRPGEAEVGFDCGCKFANHVNAVFGLCPMHEAAPDLLTALEALEDTACTVTPHGKADDLRAFRLAIDWARAAIDKAKPVV